MKKNYILGSSLLVAGLFISFEALTFSGGSPAGRSGSPASGGNTCATASCHSGPAVSTQTITITTDIPATGFEENTDYTIDVELNSGGAAFVKGGFTASIESTSGAEGTLGLGGSSDIRLTGSSFVTHTNAGNSISGNSKTYSFTWNSGTAPDKTTIYVAANFSNNNGGNSGDVIASETLELTKDASGSGMSVGELTNIKVSLFPNPASEMLIVENVPASVKELTVLNIMGQQVKSFGVSSKQNAGWELNIDDLPKGQYFLSSLGKAFQVQSFRVN